MSRQYRSTPLENLSVHLAKIEALAEIIIHDQCKTPGLIADCVVDECRLAAAVLAEAEAVYGRRRPKLVPKSVPALA
jgi:hypothetical protein